MMRTAIRIGLGIALLFAVILALFAAFITYATWNDPGHDEVRKLQGQILSSQLTAGKPWRLHCRKSAASEITQSDLWFCAVENVSSNGCFWALPLTIDQDRRIMKMGQGVGKCPVYSDIREDDISTDGPHNH